MHRLRHALAQVRMWEWEHPEVMQTVWICDECGRVEDVGGDFMGYRDSRLYFGWRRVWVHPLFRGSGAGML